MQFSHSPAIWSTFPELSAGVLAVGGVRPDLAVGPAVDALVAQARARLAEAGTESELPAIQAWRRAFSRMGLKPTQVRCASESLLRRLRKEGPPPPLHPLVDLCNAVSMATALPVAVFDVAQVAWPLQVRPATGSEHYLSFAGETESPEPGEVVFADAQGAAHARRWAHRQSARSAIRPATRDALVVVEGLHAQAGVDVEAALQALAAVLAAHGMAVHARARLSAASPAFLHGV